MQTYKSLNVSPEIHDAITRYLAQELIVRGKRSTVREFVEAAVRRYLNDLSHSYANSIQRVQAFIEHEEASHGA